MEILKNSLDAEQFQELRERCGLKPLEPELVDRALKNSLLTLCASEDGSISGMLRLVGDSALVIVLCDVMVVPERRKRGIAAALIDAALGWVSSVMPDGKWVSVVLTCSTERVSYYRKFGFRTFEECSQGCAMQAFIKGIDTGAKTV